MNQPGTKGRRLMILSGAAKDTACDLAVPTVTIGRDDTSVIVLEDDAVSRKHAELTWVGPEYRLQDRGSRNGTRVNGELIQDVLLAPGDTILFGTVEAQYLALVTADERALKDTVPISVPALTKTRFETLERERRELADQVAALRQQADQEKQTQAAHARQREQDAATRLKEVSVELTKARAEVEHLRQGAPRAQEVVPERAAFAGTLLKQIADLRRQNSELLDQLTVAEESLATVEVAPAAREAEELDRLRGEVSLLRAQLFNAGVPTPLPSLTGSRLGLVTGSGSPPPAPSSMAIPATLSADRDGDAPVAAAPAAVPVADREPAPASRGAIAALVAGGAVVAAVLTWLTLDWQRREAADLAAMTNATVAARNAALSGAEPEDNLTDPAQIVRALQLPPDAAARLHVDPQRRFVCVIPQGWSKENLPASEQSRLRLRSGDNELMVVSHGDRWPDLTQKDQAIVARDVSQRLGTIYFDGLYAEIKDTIWRSAEGTMALQFEIEVTYPDRVYQVTDVEYRSNGRANSIELRVQTPELRPELLTKLEEFVANFRSLRADEPLVAAPPLP